MSRAGESFERSCAVKIGFDVSETCGPKTGVGWYADRLVRSIAAVAPENEYILYHRFGDTHLGDPSKGTALPNGEGHVAYPGLDPVQSAEEWMRVREGKALYGNPDIVHATSFQAPTLQHTKLVYTVFDVTFWVVPQYTFEVNRAKCQKGTLDAMAAAKGLLFISESCHDEFERVFPGWLSASGVPWKVTPLGPRDGQSDLGKQDGVSEKKNFWLFVGSLEPRKNIGTLLSALEIYWELSDDPVPLKLAGGDGCETDELKRKIADLESRGLLSYLNYVTEEQLSELYQGAIAFVFPSWYEGFGLPILEAMSAGCPVITSDRTSLPEVGGDAVVYIDPQSPQSVAEAMLRLEKDPALVANLAKVGRQQAGKFTWEKTARLTLEFYEEVLQSDS